MPTYSPSVPHVEALKLSPGTQIRVDGCPSPDAKTLALNLQQGPGLNPRSPIILHLAAVFGGPNGEGARVVRNHLVGDRWGLEESHGAPMPFARGKPFSILVLVQDTHYKIAINGTHFCEFAHRLPYFSCTHLVIDGDLSLNFVEVVQTTDTDNSASAPEPSAPVEPGFTPPGNIYPHLPNNYGDNNNYHPPGGPGAPPYPQHVPPYPTAGPPGPGYPPPAYGDVPPYLPPQQGYPAPVQPAYPPPGGYPAPPPSAYPQPGYPPGAGYPASPPPGYSVYPPGPPPASHSSGGGLGGIGAALGAGGVGAALGTAASNMFGKKNQVPGAHSGQSWSGPGLGTALGVGAGALAAGALLKHVNPFKKVKKIFDYSSSDSD